MFHQIDGQGDDMVGEEDCLVMNIFTPDLEPDAPYPVMVHMMTLGNFLIIYKVWIHGGGLITGSNMASVYGASPYIDRGHTCFV